MIINSQSSKLKGTSTVTTGTGSNASTGFINNAFSPTLARLLTAPERNFALSSNISTTNNNNNNNNFFSSNHGVNLSKTNHSRSQQHHQNQHQQQDSNKHPEISCMPISKILALQQLQTQTNALLEHQFQRNQRDINKLLPKNNILFNLVRIEAK